MKAMIAERKLTKFNFKQIRAWEVKKRKTSGIFLAFLFTFLISFTRGENETLSDLFCVCGEKFNDQSESETLKIFLVQLKILFITRSAVIVHQRLVRDYESFRVGEVLCPRIALWSTKQLIRNLHFCLTYFHIARLAFGFL